VNLLIRTKNGMTASYAAKDDLLFALKWQMEMGVDCALSDSATGLCTAEAAPPPAMLAEPVASPPIAEPAAVATQIANPLSGLQSLSDLRAALEAFEGCALKKTASNLVFADGNPAADIMLIGEAPGRDEDRMGLPFVGAAGQLLDRMLKSVGMDRQDVYITNILPWRPPGNRTPSAEETQLLWPFLRRHIQLKAPKVIFALGGSSAKLLLDSQTGILKLRGQMTKIDFSDARDGSLMLPVLPSLHPAYLLRAPNMKKQAFSDLLQLCQYVKKAP
jgi:uracil-DNA glycosylase family 4